MRAPRRTRAGRPSRTRQGGAAAALPARGRAVGEALTRWRIGGSLLVSLVGYGRRGTAPRRHGLRGPRGVVAAVVAGAAGGELRLGGVVAGQRLGLRAVVVVAGEFLDQPRARGRGVEHAPVPVGRALDAHLVLDARRVAVAGAELMGHGSLLVGAWDAACR